MWRRYGFESEIAHVALVVRAWQVIMDSLIWQGHALTRKRAILLDLTGSFLLCWGVAVPLVIFGGLAWLYAKADVIRRPKAPTGASANVPG